jgi:hypothetical protein
MPVWSWILIWVLLVLGLVGMLAWFAVQLFRKLMATFSALEDLTDQVDRLDLDAVTDSPRFRPAIFQSRRELSAAIQQTRIERTLRRALRRDSSISRGKLLQHSPYKPED